ncbi:MAG: exodeoxyribonuclease VII small subunit [Solirubrobacterales bacterium]|nr:exodeoxyribonuclease VII small subunit [Solirubrobacterales bacterium]
MSEETPEEVASTYESATARLEQIIQRLDSGEAQLRETLELCEEAKGLIEYCATELAAVDQGLKELKLEDLAASLTGTDSGPKTPEVSAESDPAQSEPAAPAPTEEPPPPPEPDVPF